MGWPAPRIDMSQSITTEQKPKGQQGTWILRLLGLGLLALLLARLDLEQVQRILSRANLALVTLAVLAVIPLIFVKTIRWQGILRAQGVSYGLYPAFLSYFGSLFIGFLTPGRLGEFVKAIHVSQDCNVPLAHSFSSVLADRLFDLYALLVVGLAALVSLTLGTAAMMGILLGLLALTLPLILFLNNATFGLLQHFGLTVGAMGQKLFNPDSWLLEIRWSLRQLTWPKLLISAGLTAAAYLIFFGQCYLLALALDLPLEFIPVSYAIALGSLVTLLPISISGLGTREATIIAYLSTLGISAEAALGFSLLVFATFYLGGGLIGAVAWWLKPAPLTQLRNK